MMTNVMVKTCPNQKITKNSNLIQALKNSVCLTANATQRPIFSESRIFRSFRIVESTHQMIIMKRHLLNFSKTEFVRIFTECSEVCIEHTTWWLLSDTYSFDTSANFALWQMRHRLNPRKLVNDYQRYSMLTVPPLRSMSCTLGSSYALQATTLLSGITIHWALRRIFWKIFCVSNADKCYGENMSKPENYKKFEFDSGIEE